MKKLLLLFLCLGLILANTSAHAFLSEDWRNYKIKTYVEDAPINATGTLQSVPLATIGTGDYIIGFSVTTTHPTAGVNVGLYDTADTVLQDGSTVFAEAEASATYPTCTKWFPYPKFVSTQLTIWTDEAGGFTEIYYIDASDLR